MLDPINDAIYRVIHDYPGGIAALARRINLPVWALSRMATPGPDHLPLDVHTAVAIQLATGDEIPADLRILQAMAAVLGQACIPVMNFRQTTLELLADYAAWQAQLSPCAEIVVDACDQQRISRAEFNQLKIDIHLDAARGLAVLARLEGFIYD